ncbi:hypothetical protein RhiLY_02882 [Ceratobasidium sp. AG-Ba]|nr:hypothetical protein RhiLY_02882 [Ceratobasidium sp. AG-Ba]
MDDAFAELVLADPQDDQPPQVTSREARIARAFEQSKKTYASETVVTPRGWFQIDHLQPHTDDLSKLEARNVEWSVQRLYLQKSYEAALQLALEVLQASGIDVPTLPITPVRATLAKNEARDREMLDVAIRCAVKLRDQNRAASLAKATRDRWTNSPGLAYTAGEALVVANEPRDAISALLHAVRARTPSYAVLSLLVQALDSSTPCTESHKQLSFIISQYADRIKPAFNKGLFPPSNAPLPAKTKSTPVSEASARTLGEGAGLGEVEIGLLVALCCTSDQPEDGTPAERSVRSL